MGKNTPLRTISMMIVWNLCCAQGVNSDQNYSNLTVNSYVDSNLFKSLNVDNAQIKPVYNKTKHIIKRSVLENEAAESGKDFNGTEYLAHNSTKVKDKMNGTSVEFEKQIDKDYLPDYGNYNFTEEPCVGDPEFCNMTKEEYMEMLNDYIFPQPYEWVLIATHAIVFSIGLIGNALVCIAVYRNHSMRTVTNYFIVNLAVADFMVILICLPPTVLWDVTETWFFGTAMCRIVLYFQVSFLFIYFVLVTDFCTLYNCFLFASFIKYFLDKCYFCHVYLLNVHVCMMVDSYYMFI